jgi:hypothetical protein
MTAYKRSRIRTELDDRSGDLLHIMRNDTTANVASQLSVPNPAELDSHA